MNRSKLGAVVRRSFAQWTEDRIPRRAAALAYYAAFSLAPLLLLAIAIGGLAFGAEAVHGRVVDQLRGLLGTDGAKAVETVLLNTRTSRAGIVATVVGLVTLILGASGVFGELQDALNDIWRVKKKKGRGLRGAVRDRFLSFAFVLGFGFLLLVSLLLSAVIQAMTGIVGSWVRYAVPLKLIGEGVSFVVTATMFAMMFKMLPDARTRWRDVWPGAAFTSILFTLGKGIIGLYLGHSALASSYGAAGSFVVLLLWLYYSSQVVLTGAEMTHAYAHVYGVDPVPKRDAVTLEHAPCPEPPPAGRRNDSK